MTVERQPDESPQEPPEPGEQPAEAPDEPDPPSESDEDPVIAPGRRPRPAE